MNVPTRDRSWPAVSMQLAGGKPGYPAARAPETATARFRIDGLTCAAEATRLEHRLIQMAGIVSVTVNPINEIAYIAFEPRVTSPGQVLERIKAEGFGATDLG